MAETHLTKDFEIFKINRIYKSGLEDIFCGAFPKDSIGKARDI